MPVPVEPNYVQAEVAPESLEVPAFPPVWPEGHAGPAVTCRVGAVVSSGMVEGLRTQPDCPPSLVVAAADRLRGTPWPSLDLGGTTLSLAGHTWTQLFAPVGVVPATALAYGWRPGELPPHVDTRPTSTTPLTTEGAFLAVVTVGTDGVPRGVAVDTTPSSTDGNTAPASPGATPVGTYLPARGTSPAEVAALATVVDDPARELLAWRWPPAEAPYRVVVQRGGNAFPRVPASEPPESWLPVAPTPLQLPSSQRVVLLYERLRAWIEVPVNGPLLFHRPEAVAADAPAWLVRADARAPFSRVLAAIGALVPAGQHAQVSFAAADTDEMAATASTWSVDVSRGEAPLPSTVSRAVYFRPEDGEAWGSVVATVDRLRQEGKHPVILPDERPTPVPPAAVMGAPGGSVTGPSGEPRPVHWSEMKVKSRVLPKWPAGVPAAGETRCRVRLLVDERGIPTAVEPVDCPEPFFGAAEEALLKWRFYREQGAFGSVQFVQIIAFRGE